MPPPIPLHQSYLIPEIVRSPLTTLEEQNGDPLRANPTHYMNIYMNIYDGTYKAKPIEMHDASTKVYTSWSGPIPGSNKSASGTSSACHHSRIGTAIRVAGTEGHLTRPDSENTSEPPIKVNRPCDQPELKKQTMVT